jgi:hypothetical protein
MQTKGQIVFCMTFLRSKYICHSWMEGVKGMVAAIERHSLLWILSSVLITTFGKLWHVWIAIR